MSAVTTLVDSGITPRCKGHPEASSGWYCDACRRPLCGQCTAEEVNRYFCVYCQGPARQLTISRANVSFFRLLVAAIVYPLRKRIAMLVGVAVALTALSTLSEAITRSDAAAAQRHVTTAEPAASSNVAEGAPKAPEDDSTDAEPSRSWVPVVVAMTGVLRVTLVCLVLFIVMSTRAGDESELRKTAILWMTLYALSATVIAWLPGVAYLVVVQRGVLDEDMATDWLIWLYVLLLLSYVPIAFAVCVTGAHHRRAFNPFALSEYAWKVRWRYAATLFGLAIFASLAILVATTLAHEAMELIGIRVVAELLVYLGLMLVAMQAAHLLGSLSYVYGYEFGAGTAADFRNPLLPGATATGTLKTWAERLEKAAVNQGDVSIAREISRAAATGDGVRALRLYESRPTWVEGTFSNEDLFALASAARLARRMDVMQGLLERLVDGRDASGARAMLALARLYEDERKDKQKAEEYYRRIVERFPGTDFAKFAKKRLEG